MRSPAMLGVCSALVLAAPALAKKTPAVELKPPPFAQGPLAALTIWAPETGSINPLTLAGVPGGTEEQDKWVIPIREELTNVRLQVVGQGPHVGSVRLTVDVGQREARATLSAIDFSPNYDIDQTFVALDCGARNPECLANRLAWFVTGSRRLALFAELRSHEQHVAQESFRKALKESNIAPDPGGTHPRIVRSALSGSIAVLEFKQTVSDSGVDASYFSDVVRGRVLADAPKLKVMTRENMLVMLEASGKTLAECEGECAVDTARKLGADYVITGTLLRLGSLLKLSLKLHESKGAALMSTGIASASTPEALELATRQAVDDLFARPGDR